MKRIVLKIVMAAMVLILVLSCNKFSVSEDFVSGGVSTVTFNVETPYVLETKTISDGEKVNWVYWAAFDEDGRPVDDLNGKEPVKGKTASFDVQLVEHYPYSFVFWAQYENAEGVQTAYDLKDFVSSGKITVNYTGAANDDARDAFYRQEDITITGPGESRSIELFRPFAQINFLSSDYKSVEEVELHKSLKSTISVSGLPTVLNGLDGSVAGEGTTFLSESPVPSDPAYYNVDNEKYGWYSMNYILAAEEKDLNKVSVTFTYAKSSTPITVDVPNVPYQRNHRTNIIGRFLTEMAEVTVIVMERFDIPDNNIYDDGDSVNPPATEEIPAEGYNRVVAGDEATYTVYTPEGLEAWRKEAHEGTYAGSDNTVAVINLILGADIVLPVPAEGESNWIPVGSASDPYDGVIDGRGHTIRNMTIVSNSSEHVGFIANADNHTAGDVIFENLKFADVNISTKGGCTGALVGFVASEDGIIRNVHILGGKINSTSRYTGGIVGDSSYGNAVIDNCSNSAEINGETSVGGLAGDGYVINSRNSGNITGTGDWVGGITGGCIYKTTENCINTGAVSGVGYVAGIAGDGGTDECINYGPVKGNNFVGGIVGDCYYKYSVSNCVNYGTVKGNDRTGGIVGRSQSNTAITDCQNHGNVYGDTLTGGILGGGTSVKIIDCMNDGDIAVSRWHTGGIAGDITSGSTVSGCENYGLVSAVTSSGILDNGTSIGGIVGFNNGSSSVDANHNYGDIKGYGGTGGVVGYNVQGNVIDNSTDADVYHVNSIEYGIVVGRSDAGEVTGNTSTGNIIRIDALTLLPL